MQNSKKFLVLWSTLAVLTGSSATKLQTSDAKTGDSATTAIGE